MEEHKQIKNYKILYFHFFFICLFFLHLGSIYADLSWLRIATKPLICSSLLMSLVLFKKLNSKYQRLIAVGLFFGLLGDVFLMLADQFMLGLLSFLLGHLCYIIAFLKQKTKINLLKEIPALLLLGLLIAFSYYFYGILSPSLGPLKIPVLLYVVTISALCYFAFRRSGSRFTWNFLTGFIGSVLFIVSDSVLALNKFVAYIPTSGLVIMSTYMLAQYFIYTTALSPSTAKD